MKYSQVLVACIGGAALVSALPTSVPSNASTDKTVPSTSSDPAAPGAPAAQLPVQAGTGKTSKTVVTGKVGAAGTKVPAHHGTGKRLKGLKGIAPGNLGAHILKGTKKTGVHRTGTQRKSAPATGGVKKPHKTKLTPPSTPTTPTTPSSTPATPVSARSFEYELDARAFDDLEYFVARALADAQTPGATIPAAEPPTPVPAAQVPVHRHGNGSGKKLKGFKGAIGGVHNLNPKRTKKFKGSKSLKLSPPSTPTTPTTPVSARSFLNYELDARDFEDELDARFDIVKAKYRNPHAYKPKVTRDFEDELNARFDIVKAKYRNPHAYRPRDVVDEIYARDVDFQDELESRSWFSSIKNKLFGHKQAGAPAGFRNAGPDPNAARDFVGEIDARDFEDEMEARGLFRSLKNKVLGTGAPPVTDTSVYRRDFDFEIDELD